VALGKAFLEIFKGRGCIILTTRLSTAQECLNYVQELCRKFFGMSLCSFSWKASSCRTTRRGTTVARSGCRVWAWLCWA